MLNSGMRFARWQWLPSLVLALVAAALCFVPLFDVLGYELAFALGLVAAVTSLVVGLGAGRAHPDPLDALGWALVVALAGLVTPLALTTLNALRVKNCNYLVGLSYFALLPTVTSLYGAALGVLVAKVLAETRRAARTLVAVLVLATPLVVSLWRLYTEPPIFAFDHLWGHFAGSLYDEVVEIGPALLWFRLGTLLRVLAVAVLLFAWGRRSRTPRLVSAALALTALAAPLAYDLTVGPAVGFRVDRADILRVLSDVEERPGLVIHLPPGLALERRRAIADDHAFRLAEIEAALGVEALPTVHSFVYANAEQKARLMGGRTTMIAKPWSFEIHVHDAVAPHAVVAHELVHVVAAAFAPPPLRVSSRALVLVNLALVEGLAEALTVPAGDLDRDAASKAMQGLGLAPNVRGLVGPAGFWAQAPRRAYTVAGSFVGFLLRRYGPAPFERAYAHGELEEAYGKSVDELVREWEEHLSSLTLSPADEALAADMFKTPSIFAKTCAHEVAALRNAAARTSPREAVALYERVSEHLGASPQSRYDIALALWRADDVIGFEAAARALLAGPGLTSAQLARLRELLGDAAWQRGDLATAAGEFRAVMARGLGAASERLQWVRLWALAQPRAAQEPVRGLLSDRLAPLAAVLAMERARRDLPQDKTLPYLIARQLERADDCAQALGYLDAAAGHPYPLIEAERVRLEGACAARQGDLARARAAYERYGELAPSSGEKARAKDELRRIAWRQRS